LLTAFGRRSHYASLDKTASPRFDTLIVRGGPAKGSRMNPAYEEILYDGCAARQGLFRESVTQKA
jgi:hypothetical protein